MFEVVNPHIGQAPKRANSIPVQDWGYMWDRHTQDNARNDKTSLQNDILVDSGKKVHFVVKKNVWGGIVEITFFNIKN